MKLSNICPLDCHILGCGNQVVGESSPGSQGSSDMLSYVAQRGSGWRHHSVTAYIQDALFKDLGNHIYK